MKTYTESYHYGCAAEAFEALSFTPFALFFDGMRAGDPRSRYSYICVDPIEIITAKDGAVAIDGEPHEGNPFDVLAERLALHNPKAKTDSSFPPFQGGAAGFFGYDLGRDLEKIPATAQDDLEIPDMVVGIYDTVIAYDHALKKCMIISHTGKKRVLQIMEMLNSKFETAPNAAVELLWRADCDEKEYLKKIEKVRDYIAAGDIYQVNISRRFTAALPENFDAYRHYKHLRTINAAPFSAFMNLGDVKISSSSPERFLRVQDNRVETRPIKGTVSDTLPASALLESEKERAENLMIVDLMRSDIGKVCKTGSIKVPQLFGIETYEGLHHLVSSITGELKDGISATALLKACFPGGSVTGAPKIRAMEIIEELEPNRRGPYCGALGYIGFDGAMDTSIAIRTLVYTATEVQLQTGGGITMESDAQKELEETLTKAKKLFESFASLQRPLKKAV